ncbi:sensor protein [Flammeovirgaceae bacterium 311]|nr:sensor protein [Flammeovirgaceae bacterium 311]
MKNSASDSTPDKLAKRLSGYELLQDVPQEQLLWLTRTATVRKLKAGEKLFRKDDPIDFLFLVLSGKIQFKLEQKGEYRIINELIEGDISGALPYSRAKNAMALGEAKGATEVLQLSKDHFREMIHEQPELTEALVHVMASRIRDFTTEQQQTEKMASLGRLSAGLHHELNNPAAAALRASTELKEQLSMVPEKFKAIMLLRLSPEQVDQIMKIVFSPAKKEKSKSKLSLMERSEGEDQLAEWLEQRGIDNAYAIVEVFAEKNIKKEVLQQLEEICGEDQVGAVTEWIYNVLITEKLVSDIQESTRRISGLVSAVKSYSHMDQGLERERTDLEENIRSTLVMLNSKIKKKKIAVNLEGPDNLVQPCVYIGELNQVWTNLIDNAIDAVEEGGRLDIQLQQKEQDIEVSIIDNGSGISEGVLGRIFDPFFTTKAMGDGSGMGLDISKKIIEQHGGTIEVESKPGRTVFRVTLPENPQT